MADTKIQWATKVWNPVTGCTPISTGCQNCYAKRMANRLRGRYGYPEDEPFRVTIHPEKLDEPLKWRKPQRIFVNSMSDLFHHYVPDNFICDIFARMKFAKQHTFLILTKRPEIMRDFFKAWDSKNWPLPNVWLGVTAENQEMADLRIPILLQIPAAIRFVSIEPMLGPIDLSQWFPWDSFRKSLPGWKRNPDYKQGLHWIICGGESGPKVRPMHPDWVRSIRDQCQTADVPFFFKSWGEWAYNRQPNKNDLLDARKELIVPFHGEVTTGLLKYGDDAAVMRRVGKKIAGDLLDEKQYHEFPEV